MKIRLLVLLFAGLGLTSCSVMSPQKVKYNSKTMDRAYIGTYTKKEGHVDGKAAGILHVNINRQSGEITNIYTVASVINPSFVRLSPDGRFLFAVSELGPGDADSGFIYSFKAEKDGSLKEVSRLSTEAYAPAHIEVDKTGSLVFVSNYSGGVVMVYGVKEDGSLERKQRIDLENPDQSHAHSLTVSPDNTMAYIADLGNDRIWIYNLNVEEGILKPASRPYLQLEKGAGPRHFTISSDGRFAYSMNELNSSVSVFRILGDGSLEIKHTISSLPEDFSGKNSGADIWLHPTGQWLYVSNRGHNSIALFDVNKETGDLEAKNYTSTAGKTPRAFSVSSDGIYLYVANQDSDDISVFTIDESSGDLKIISRPSPVPTPVRIELVRN